MNICQHHWALVTQGVKDRGLWHLVSQDSEAAMGYMVAQPQRGTAFDPLLEYGMHIYSKAISIFGLGVLGHNPDNEDGHYCPMCMVKASFDHHNKPGGVCGDPECTIKVEPGEVSWEIAEMDKTLDAMLKHCRELGLVAPLQ